MEPSAAKVWTTTVGVSERFFEIGDLESPGERVPFDDAHTGLITASEGWIVIATGVWGGPIELRVELHLSAPDVVPDEWEDVAETSLLLASEVMSINNYEADPVEFSIGRGSFRARVHARGRDLQQDLQVEEVVEHYLLQLWPAEPEPPQLLRAGSSLSIAATSAPDRRGGAWASSGPPPKWLTGNTVTPEQRERLREEQRAEELHQREVRRRLQAIERDSKA